MAKKRKQQPPTSLKHTDHAVTLSDVLQEDILAQLQAKKKSLLLHEAEQEETRLEQKRREMKEREKNKTFEELLDAYGDIGSKY